MFLMQIVILYFPSLLLSVIFCGICLLLQLSFIVSGSMVNGGEGAYLMRRHYIFITLYIYIYIYMKNFIPLLYFVHIYMLQVTDMLDLFSRFIQFIYWTVHQLLECFFVILGCVMEIALLTFAFNTSAVVGAFLYNKLVSIWNYCPFFL